ncbi:MAG: hypothetical protein ACYDA8_21045 [Deferrisomatales bacterium]
MVRTHRFAPIAAVVLAGTVLAAAPRDAGAISAFSRQYDTECSTCHSPFPRRNEFGEAFRKNGYVWPGRPAGQKPPGAKESLWLSAVPEAVPLSVSLRQDVGYDARADQDKVSPDTHLLLHAGGTLRDQVGFFAHDLTASGTGEVFGVLRHIAGSPVNARLGRLTPQTTLWKDSQGATAAALATANFAVTGGGGASLGTPRDALELNAVLGSRLFLAAGVADRQNQDAMEYFGHLSYKLGGTDFLGREPDLDLDRESVWDYLTVTLGAFGYLGRVEKPTHDTDYRRLGGELSAQYRGVTLLFSGVSGRDDDLTATGFSVDSVVLAAELDYFFAPRYLAAARYENEDVGNAPTGIVKRVIGGFTWIPMESLQFRLEGRWARSQDPADPVEITGLFRAEYHL